MLTTYSPIPLSAARAQRRLLTSPSNLPRGLPIRSGGGRPAGPSERPIIATPRYRSGGFRFLAPDSPRLLAAARLAGCWWIRDKPDTMDRDGS